MAHALLILLATGCNLTSAAAVPTALPTATSASALLGDAALATAVPTLARWYQPVAARTRPAADDAAATPDASVTASEADEPGAGPGCDPESAALPLHRVEAEVDYPTRGVEARHWLTYTNTTGETLDNLVLNIEANRWLEAFTLIGLLQHPSAGDAESGAQTPTHTLTGRRLFIELLPALDPGCVAELELVYRMTVPQMRGGVEAFDGYFGASPRQINLGHWLPTVAARQGGDWVTRQYMFIGEQEVVEKADWEVTLRVVNAADTLRVAAPGIAETLGENAWRYSLANARDFPVSLSEQFVITRLPSELGVTLELYTFSDASVVTESGVVDGAGFAANIALRSFETYSALFGPYPYDRLLVVQGDFPDGMEFSGLAFVSTNWFTSYQGDPAAFLTLITVHEVAHQWWYASVGNDPAMQPWLDEALSTYSEYIFIEQFYPSLKEWWWSFRVDAHSPTGYVDSSIYEFTSIRQYINAVYLRGVRMLHALRTDLGTEAFFALLRAYAEGGAGQIVDEAFFWSLLTPEQLEATKNTRAAYLRQPNP